MSLDRIFNKSAVCAYRDNDEVQPAPRVGEVLLEAVSRLLDQHLDEERYSESTIDLLQRQLQHPPFLQILVLDRLSTAGKS